MNTEAEIISESWHTLQEYISARDKQIAADHFIGFVIDLDLPHSEFIALVNSNEHLKEAAAEYLEETEEDLEYE